MLKKLFFLFALLIILNDLKAEPGQLLSVGPFLTFKGGVNGSEVLKGRKNKVTFNSIPDFGASCFVPLNETGKLAVIVDLAYSSYSFGIKDANGTKEFTENFSYVSLSPNFYFQGFYIGFNFGMPAAADFGSTIDVGKIATLTEIRVGGKIPLYTDDTGTLNFIIQGAYMLSGVFSDFENNDPLKNEIPPIPPDKLASQYNPRVVSASLGISYLFNINYGK